MEKVILVCDECGCDIENNTYAAVYNFDKVVITECMSSTRSVQETIDTFAKLHFCSKECIEQFFRNTARDIWDAKYPIICKYDGKPCDYEGPEGKGYCKGCARE